SRCCTFITCLVKQTGQLVLGHTSVEIQKPAFVLRHPSVSFCNDIVVPADALQSLDVSTRNIFTDGSKKATGTGAAFVDYENNAPFSFVKKCLRDDPFSFWETRWVTSNNGSGTKE